MATIVTGFVDTPEGNHALDTAIEEAKRRSASLVVVHSLVGGRSTSEEEIQAGREAAEKIEERLKGEDIDHEIKTYVRGQTPAEDVLQAARDFDADLIVIGYRRRTSTGKALLGSAAQDILMGAPCPVLATLAPD